MHDPCETSTQGRDGIDVLKKTAAGGMKLWETTKVRICGPKGGDSSKGWRDKRGEGSKKGDMYVHGEEIQAHVARGRNGCWHLVSTSVRRGFSVIFWCEHKGSR